MTNTSGISPSIIFTLALGGCFDPVVEQDESNDASATSGSTTEPAADTGSPGGSDDRADSTGSTDAPPIITAFTVDSSTMPAELQHSGLASLDVDAMDDLGIDRIEIYDGDTLVTIVTEIPYRDEILLTSMNNGSHAYTAIAFDTAGQTAESNVVPLSVNIEGGSIREIRQDIADFRVNYALTAMPRVAIDPADEVVILASVREDVAEDARYGLSAISHTDGLSLLWEDTRWPSTLGPYSAYANAGRPAYDALSSSWWTGLGIFGELGNQRAVAIIDGDNDAIASIEPLGGSEGLFMSPVALDSRGAIVLAPAPGQLQKLSALDQAPVWTIEIDEALYFTDILVAPDDTLIVAFTGGNDGCSGGESHCVYKISSSGDVLWTRTAPTSSTAWTLGVAISPEGHVALAGSDDGPVRLAVYDETGTLLTDRLLTEELHHDVRDIAYDAQGALVLAGDWEPEYGAREAWAGRYDDDGNPIWFRTYPFDDHGGITGLSTNASGKLFAVGWEQRFDLDLFGWSGRGWIAELAL